MLSKILIAAPVLLLSVPAFATQDAVINLPPLPAPGVMGLVAAGVIGAILVARGKK